MFRSSGRLAFAFMAISFRVRDAIWPPEWPLRELGIAKDLTVLDFGCGPGSYSIAAARLVGPHGRVYSVDTNPWAVRWVQDAAQKRGLENVIAIESDGLGPLPPQTMDFALVRNVLHELDAPATVLDGIARVLKLDGTLAVGDFFMSGQAILNAITADGNFVRTRQVRDLHCFRRRLRERQP
jgi:ubiquinone/menaquinone biosynthesis C-methylase UbiE